MIYQINRDSIIYKQKNYKEIFKGYIAKETGQHFLLSDLDDHCSSIDIVDVADFSETWHKQELDRLLIEFIDAGLITKL